METVCLGMVVFSRRREDVNHETEFLQLLERLSQCKALTSLSLSDVRLRLSLTDDASTRCVTRLIHELPCLETLNLTKNKVKPETRSVIEVVAPTTLELMF